MIQTLLDRLQRQTSGWALIAANMLPLFGVMFWSWSAFDVIFLYWLENVVIGVYNVIKMIGCSPDSAQIDVFGFGHIQSTRDARSAERNLGSALGWLNFGLRFVVVPFFIFHYGMFCFVHGVFIFVLFGGDNMRFAGFFAWPENFWSAGLLIAAAGLALSHGYSLIVNYFGHGEYRRSSVPQLMAAPYGRVVILHVAIIAGGFLITFLGSPALALALFVLLKTGFDLALHLREHAAGHEPLRAPDGAASDIAGTT